MNANETPRDIFGVDTLHPDELDNFKTKLQWAVNHLHKEESAKSLLVSAYGARIKWFKKMSNALAESLKFKSTLPMEQAWGDTWREQLGSFQALYSKFDEDKP